MGVTFFNLPEIPKQVDISDLHDGLLLTQYELNDLINSSNFEEERRYSKTETHLGYGIIRHEDQFYVVYKGAKHQKALGQGANGSAKIVQFVGSAKQEAASNRRIGEFYALKLTRNISDAANEHDALKTVNQTTLSPLTPRKSKDKSLRSELQKLFSHQASLKNLGVFIDPANPPTNEILHDQGQIIMHLISGISIEKFIQLEFEHLTREVDRQEAVNPTQEAVLTPDHFVINPALRIQLLISAFESIEALHTKYKMLHRDIHPGNILIDRAKQTACLIDYGFALKFTDPISAVTLAKLKAAISYVPELRVKLTEKLNATDKKIELEEKLDANGLDLGEKQRIRDQLAELQESGKCDPDVIISTKAEAYTAGNLGAYFTYLNTDAPDNKDPRTWDIRDNGIMQSVDDDFFLRALPQAEHQAVLVILNKLAAEKPTQRYTFKEAITQLKGILKEYIHQNNVKLKSGILDVEKYLTADDAEKQAFIEQAQQFDEIWLIDTNLNRVDQLTTYLKVKREIGLLTPKKNPDDVERLGVAVGDKVAVGREVTKMLAVIQKDLDKRPVPAICEMLTLKPSLKPGMS